jgi:hypothetical protein
METLTSTALTTYGYAKDGKVFLKGYLDMADREIGVVRNSEDESLQYFINRFAIAERKALQLLGDIDTAQNKGSYLTKLTQLRKDLLAFDGLGDFIPLLKKLDVAELELRELILNNQLKNLEIKRALIEDLKAATVVENEEEWQIATDKVVEIKNKWLKTGPVDKMFQDEIEQEFANLNDTFFQNRREYYAEKNRLIDERLATLEKYVDESRQLSYSHDFDISMNRIKEIQNLWKNIGAVPARKGSKLYKRFRRNVDKFFERYNNAKGIVRQPRIDPNIQILQDMVREGEVLLQDQPNMSTSAEKAKEMLVKWKATVLKVKNVDRNLAERFRMICDKIFELNYLFRVISYRHPDLFTKPRLDQLKIMINQMDYMSKKEKTELDSFIISVSGYGEIPKDDQKKIDTQKRKIGVKEVLLGDFKKELEVLLPQQKPLY